MKIHIVGWAGITHSYSIIAETYLRKIMERKDVVVYFTEYPYFYKDWKKCKKSIFDKFQKPSADEIIDITIRFIYPYNLIPDVQSKCTISFMTCEFDYVSDFVDVYDICDNVWIMTPSEYSRRGLIASGIKSEKIFVIPHSYDCEDILIPRNILRDNYKIPQNDFVYFHNSSLT